MALVSFHVESFIGAACYSICYGVSPILSIGPASEDTTASILDLKHFPVSSKPILPPTPTPTQGAIWTALWRFSQDLDTANVFSIELPDIFMSESLPNF
jgi:hypothetical protein